MIRSLETLNPLGFTYPEGLPCSPYYPGVPFYIAPSPCINGPIPPPSSVEPWRTDVPMTDPEAEAVGIFPSFSYTTISVDSFNRNTEENKDKGKKKEQVPPVLREQVWQTYFGPTEMGTCFCCGCHLPKTSWYCRHVIPPARNGTMTLDNLRPVCVTCSSRIGTRYMYDYIAEINTKRFQSTRFN